MTYREPIPARINIQHRLIYQILDDEKVVKVIRIGYCHEYQAQNFINY